MNITARSAGGGGWTPSLVLSTIVMMMICEASALGYIIVSTGLPAITAEFQTTQGGWLLTAYILAGGVVGPLAGKLADIYGKRRMMLVVLGIALVGAVLATWAPTFTVLIVGRFLQGTVTAATFLVYSLMRDVFPKRILPLAISISITGVGVFSVGTPFLVGWLLDSYGWRGLFTFDIFWIAALAPLLILTTKESPVRVPSKVDFLGAGLLGAGVALVLIAVSNAPTNGWVSLFTIGLGGLGLVLVAAFAVVSLRRAEPLVDLRVFTRKPVLLAAITAGCAYGMAAAYSSVVPLLAMIPRAAGGDYGLGLTAMGYSVISAPSALLIVLGGAMVGTLVVRVGGVRLMTTGLLLMGAAGVLASFRHDTVADLLISGLVFGLGSGLCYGSVPNLVVAATPADKQGSIAGMVSVVQGTLASIAPVVLFVILATGATPLPGGRFVYTSTAIQYGLWFMAGIAVIAVLLISTVLRSRATTPGAPMTATPAAAPTPEQAEAASPGQV